MEMAAVPFPGEDDDDVVDVEAREIVEPDDGGLVQLEIVKNFVVEARFGFAIDGRDNRHVAGAKIDRPAKPDIRLENARIGGADFAEIGVARERRSAARGQAPEARRSARSLRGCARRVGRARSGGPRGSKRANFQNWTAARVTTKQRRV